MNNAAENDYVADLQFLQREIERHQELLIRILRRRAVRVGLRVARLFRPYFRIMRTVRAWRESHRSDVRFSTDVELDPFHIDDYQLWITRNGVAAREQIGERDQKDALFSVIVPVSNPPIRFLRTCIESVLNQSFPHFQLVLVDDASTDSATVEFLDRVVHYDSRVSVIRNRAPRGISLSTAKGIDESKANWIAFVDHDDVLHQDALNRCAEQIESNADVRLLFTDEDKISTGEQRFHPRFKCGFDPVRLLHENYMAHFLVCRRDIIGEADVVWEAARDGAQDWSLILQVTKSLRRNQIAHVPVVAYSWRQSSHQFSRQQADASARAGATVVQSHLDSIQPRLKARAHSTQAGAVELMPRPDPSHRRVGAVIQLLSCVPDSIVRTLQNARAWREAGCETVTVLCPPEAVGSLKTQFAEHSWLKISVRDRHEALDGGPLESVCEDFVGGSILLLGEATAPWSRHGLDVLMEYLEIPGVGAVGPRIVDARGRIRNLGAIATDDGYSVVGLGLNALQTGYFGDAIVPHEVALLDAGAVLLKAERLKDVLGESSPVLDFSVIVHRVARKSWASAESMVLVPNVAVRMREREGDCQVGALGEYPACSQTEDLSGYMHNDDTLLATSLVPRLHSALVVSGAGFRLRRQEP